MEMEDQVAAQAQINVQKAKGIVMTIMIVSEIFNVDITIVTKDQDLIQTLTVVMILDVSEIEYHNQIQNQVWKFLLCFYAATTTGNEENPNKCK